MPAREGAGASRRIRHLAIGGAAPPRRARHGRPRAAAADEILVEARPGRRPCAIPRGRRVERVADGIRASARRRVQKSKNCIRCTPPRPSATKTVEPSGKPISVGAGTTALAWKGVAYGVPAMKPCANVPALAASMIPMPPLNSVTYT